MKEVQEVRFKMLYFHDVPFFPLPDHCASVEGIVCPLPCLCFPERPPQGLTAASFINQGPCSTTPLSNLAARGGIVGAWFCSDEGGEFEPLGIVKDQRSGGTGGGEMTYQTHSLPSFLDESQYGKLPSADKKKMTAALHEEKCDGWGEVTFWLLIMQTLVTGVQKAFFLFHPVCSKDVTERSKHRGSGGIWRGWAGKKTPTVHPFLSLQWRNIPKVEFTRVWV